MIVCLIVVFNWLFGCIQINICVNCYVILTFGVLLPVGMYDNLLKGIQKDNEISEGQNYVDNFKLL